MKDIFGDESFERLYEKIEDGKQEVFEFHLPIGEVRHSFIKREISVQIDGEVYYDITTPYSYGGPVVFECHEDYKWELVDEFQRAFQAFCEENKIVSEYIRFDPVQTNVFDFVCVYEVECIGEIKGINMVANTQTHISEFSSYDRKEFFETENNEKTCDLKLYVGKKIWNEEIYKKYVQLFKLEQMPISFRHIDLKNILNVRLSKFKKYNISLQSVSFNKIKETDFL
ncbi:hypothetical protein [Planococcus koreensis]|uniref:hypothetical protein n=1 Tax=Planococcus koreensis TaxID=112331 RepID=UPI0039FD486B